MKKTKEIGYELLGVVNMDGFMKLWNSTDTETKDTIVNGIGELAVKLVNEFESEKEKALHKQSVNVSSYDDLVLTLFEQHRDLFKELDFPTNEKAKMLNRVGVSSEYLRD